MFQQHFEVLSSGKSVVDVHKIQSWTKSVLALANFTFVYLHHNSVNSKAYTMKANRYLLFSWQLYTKCVGRWASGVQWCSSYKMSLLSSLKANKVYVVYQIMFFQPPAHALKGSMRHATTLQLSCSTWKVSLDTVTSIYLPTDSAATDHLQPGMSPCERHHV